MNIRTFFLLCTISLCSTLSWGQTWKLSSTMTAELTSSGWLVISSTAPSEAMPNFTRDNPGPWKSLRSNFGVEIVENITSIGNYAFAGCEHLTTIRFITNPSIVGGIPIVKSTNYLISIGEGAFEGCTQLGANYIGLPESLKSIGNYAFRGCTSFKSIHFPNSLTSIGDGAFQDCIGLSTIWVKWETPLPIPDNVFASLNTANIDLLVPKGTKSHYEKANVWKDFDIQVDSPTRYNHSDTPIEHLGFYINLIIGERALASLVLFLSVILFFMRIAKKKDEPRQGTTYVISNILFLTACTLEIMYVISADDAVWFCMPDEVGWLWTVINFFLFAGIAINQVLYLFDILADVFVNGNAVCDFRLGLYSWVGAFVCVLLCKFFFEAGLPWVYIILGIMQFTQLVFIFSSFGKNIKGAFWGVFVYLLGTIGTAVTLLIFIGLLILVVVLITVGWMILKLTGVADSSGRTSSSSSSTSNQFCRTCMHYPGTGYNCVYKGMVTDNTTACNYWRRS